MPPRLRKPPEGFIPPPRLDIINIGSPPAVPSPDVGKKIRRRYGLMGPEPIQSISPELQSVVIVDDLTGPALHDVDYLRNCFQGTTITGVAAQNGHVQLFNPAGSGVDLLVEGVIVSVSGADTPSIRTHDTALTTNIGGTFRDRRLIGSPAGQVRRLSVAPVLGTQIGLFRIQSSDAILVPLDFILEPGQGIHVAATVLNNSLEANYYWTERARPRT